MKEIETFDQYLALSRERRMAESKSTVCHGIPVILFPGMQASGLEERIGMGYLLGSHEYPERLTVLVPAHPGCHGDRATKRVCCLVDAEVNDKDSIHISALAPVTDNMDINWFVTYGTSNHVCCL